MPLFRRPSDTTSAPSSRRFALRFAIASSTLIGIGTVAYGVHQSQRAEALIQGARTRLEAPFVEAPGVDRVQASSAVSALEEAVEMGRNENEVRGLLHYARALEDLQRGDLILAEGELESANRFVGENANLLVLSAALSRGRLLEEDAQREIARALELEPDHTRGLLLAADIALDGENSDLAREHLTHLASLVPDSSTVHNRLGLALESDGDMEGAERELRDAVRLDRQGHDALINLGRLLRSEDRHREALDAFEAAVTRAPSDSDALFGRGLARAATGDVQAAEADFRRAAELAPNDAEPLLALGDLQRDLGSVEEAVTTYRAAIDREDADAASWLKLGNSLALLEDYEAATHAFEAAIRRAPELSAAYNGLGASLMHRGQREEARVALEHAASLDPSDPNPLMNIALMSESDGTEDATRAWERVLTVWPNSPIAQRRLARLSSHS
jgi:tetratricopeptide (TPR) repeat protein